MSKWLFILLLCITSNAFASPADSGRCPWKIPFVIKIHAVGILNNFHDEQWFARGQETRWSSSRPDSIDFSFAIDTASDTTWCLFRKSLLSVKATMLGYAFTDTTGPNPACMPWGGAGSLTITFVRSMDSIQSITFADSSWSTIQSTYNHSSYALHMSSLRFDDTSIFTFDPSYLGHKIDFHYEHVERWPYPSQSQYPFTLNNTSFTATSVDLSGIFRPTHFADQAAVTIAQPSVKGLEITASGGALHCSFGATAESRSLEVYSPLGVRIARYPVPAGATEAQIKLVVSGLYFVRLDRALSKVYVAE